MTDDKPTPKTKRPRRVFTAEFKDAAVKLVARGELSIPRVARDLGISDSLLRLWVEKAKTAENGGLTADERIELARLRKENRILKEEREILKSGDLLREGEPIVNRYRFIEAEKVNHSLVNLCRVIRVIRSAFHAWRRQMTTSTERDELSVRVREKFERSRGRCGSRRIQSELAADGISVSRSTVARRMRTQDLHARRRRPFTRTTDSDHSDPVAENLLNREFTADAPNQR